VATRPAGAVAALGASTSTASVIIGAGVGGVRGGGRRRRHVLLRKRRPVDDALAASAAATATASSRAPAAVLAVRTSGPGAVHGVLRVTVVLVAETAVVPAARRRRRWLRRGPTAVLVVTVVLLLVVVRGVMVGRRVLSRLRRQTVSRVRLAPRTLRVNSAGLLLLLLLMMVAAGRLVIRLRVVRPGSELWRSLGRVLLAGGHGVHQVVGGQRQRRHVRHLRRR